MKVTATLLLLASVVPKGAFAQGATIGVTPPGTARAGSTVTVKWSGPNGPGDYITVVRKGSDPFAYLDYKLTSNGRTPVNPVSLVLPAEPGAYEIRYVTGNPRRVLATVPYDVIAIAATVEGPVNVAPDARFEVAWVGPNNGGDWVTIVAAGAAPRAYGSYVDARTGRADDRTGRRVATLRAPTKPGQYELRYVQQGTRVIGTRAIEVTSAASSGIAAGGAAAPASGAGAASTGGAGASPTAAADAAATGVGGAASGAAAIAGNAAAGAGPAQAINAGSAPASASGAAVSSPAAGSGSAAGAGAAPAGGSGGAALAGSAGAASKGAGDSQTPARLMTTTTGRALSEAVGAVNAWSGWLRCQLATSVGLYRDSQTQTWTISGPGTMDGGREVYPATWSVSGEGGVSRGIGSAGSFAGGDYEHRFWQINATGVAAPLALSVRASDNRVILSSAHARLQSQVSVDGYIGNESGDQMSMQLTSTPATVYELTLPAIEDVATSTRLSGSSSLVVAYAVSPLQPADARPTASCTWLFEKGPTFSALQPPPEPPTRARRTLPPAIVERLVASQPVRVLAPNGIEDWAVNSRHEVTWTHTLGAGQRFDIDISVDGGTTWLPLGRSVSDDGSGSRGAFTATMPAVGSTAGLVRVGPAGNASAGDVSDSGFKLGAAWMRILTPMSATVPPGGSFVVQVETNLGIHERYTIAVTYDNVRWETVTTSGTSGMSVSVPLTAPLSNTGPGSTVRVTSNTVPTLSVIGYLRIK